MSATESTRPTVMIVDLDAIKHNYTVIKERMAPAKVMAVVKANAYGHGLLPTARALESLKADCFGVALVEEGIELRQGGITAPILVFGGIFGDQIEQYLRHNLDLTASSVGKLELIEATAQRLNMRARVHLKIDTGMGRIGIQYNNAQVLFDAISRCKSIDVVGVFSHLATAEDTEDNYSKLQCDRFDECVKALRKTHTSPVDAHLLNSAGIVLLPEARHQMVRAGLSIYGVNPVPSVPLDLKPAMTLRTQVVYFKVLPKGANVSYGRTWKSDKMTRIVTIPIGYGDGNFRRLSNCGHVLIRGKKYPIVGTVCMDQMMIDIGWDEAFNGDEVILLGSQGSESITVSDLAKAMGTIEHEVLTSTNMRVPRIYK